MRNTIKKAKTYMIWNGVNKSTRVFSPRQLRHTLSATSPIHHHSPAVCVTVLSGPRGPWPAFSTRSSDSICSLRSSLSSSASRFFNGSLVLAFSTCASHTNHRSDVVRCAEVLRVTYGWSTACAACCGERDGRPSRRTQTQCLSSFKAPRTIAPNLYHTPCI